MSAQAQFKAQSLPSQDKRRPDRMEDSAGRRQTTPFTFMDWLKELPNEWPHIVFFVMGVLASNTLLPDHPVTVSPFSLRLWIPVLARNVITIAAVYGLCHWLFYQVKLLDTDAKLIKNWPSEKQHRRDRFWTIVSALISGCFEVVYLLLLASGYLPRPALANLSVGYVLAGFVVIALWNSFHGYIMHRLIHPWRISWLPCDPGHYLYKHVHSIHHKSYNPGPWTGLSMHPIEAILDLSAVCINFVIFTHPIFFYYNKFLTDFAPCVDHLGFEGAMGSSIHNLHHTKFDFNYGGRLVPLDAIFGTYREE